jgi:hypothetical protein
MKKWLFALSILFGVASVALACAASIMVVLDCVNKANDVKTSCVSKAKGLRVCTETKLRDALNKRLSAGCC